MIHLHASTPLNAKTAMEFVLMIMTMTFAIVTNKPTYLDAPKPEQTTMTP